MNFCLNIDKFLIFLIVKNDLEELAMTERIETLIPLIYIICMLMGWFGPNATILGGIKLTLWQHGAIKDLNIFLTNVTLFVSVDLVNFILNWILLKTTVNINLMSNLKTIQKDFWLLMAFQETALFIEVRTEVLVDCKIYSLVIVYK